MHNRIIGLVQYIPFNEANTMKIENHNSHLKKFKCEGGKLKKFQTHGRSGMEGEWRKP